MKDRQVSLAPLGKRVTSTVEELRFDSLQVLIRLACKVLHAQACSVAWVGWIDTSSHIREQVPQGSGNTSVPVTWVRDKGSLMTVECAGEPDFKESMTGRVVSCKENGGFIDSQLFDVAYFKTRRCLEVSDLRQEDNGVCDPDIANKYGLASLLAAPIIVENEVVGFINHFTAKITKSFDESLKDQLLVFAELAGHVLERERRQAVLDRINEMSDRLLWGNFTDTSDFMKELIDFICKVLGTDLGVVWHHDEQRNRLLVTATTDAMSSAWPNVRDHDLDEQNAGYQILVGEKDRYSFVIKDVRREKKFGHPEMANDLGLCTLLTIPLRAPASKVGETVSPPSLLGSIDVYTRQIEGEEQPRPFDASEIRLLEAVVQRVAAELYHAELRLESRLAETMHALTHEARNIVDGEDDTEEPIPKGRQAFLRSLMHKTKELTDLECLVWGVDQNTNQLRFCGERDTPKATNGQALPEEDLDIVLDSDLGKWIIGLSKPERRMVKDANGFALPKTLKKWLAHKSIPEMMVHCIKTKHNDAAGETGRIYGCVAIIRKKKDIFRNRHLRQLESVVELAAADLDYITVALQQKMLGNVLPSLSKVGIWHGERTDEEAAQDFYRNLIRHARRLVGGMWGGIARYELDDRLHPVSGSKGEPLAVGILPERDPEGITGLAIKNEKVTNVGDVQAEEYGKYYRAQHPETRSELAVPLIVEEPMIRDGQEHRRNEKSLLLGVLNLESPTLNAFSSADERVLHAFGSLVTTLLAAQDFAWKVHSCMDFGETLFKHEGTDPKEAYKLLSAKINELLAYNYVNISQVDLDNRVIETVYARGVKRKKRRKGPKPDKTPNEEFMATAKHSLDGLPKDIQVVVYESQKACVPRSADPRLDRTIYERFLHNRLTRVIVPILDADNNCLGTLEAGRYDCPRPYVLETDVYILSIIASHLARFFKKQSRGQIKRINHEILNTVNGIRNKADVLFRYGPKGAWSYAKVDDILWDCDTLDYQVWGLRHFFGMPQPDRTTRKVLFYRDVIVKNVEQLKREAKNNNLDVNKISVNDIKLSNLPPLRIDPSRFNQVVWNLLINSFKYRKRKRKEFWIRLDLDESDRKFWILRVQDRGIGINSSDRSHIFDDYFRSEEAKRRVNAGQGIGLPLSRSLMLEVGGDVRLAPLKEDGLTEFQVWIPRSLEYQEKTAAAQQSEAGRS